MCTRPHFSYGTRSLGLFTDDVLIARRLLVLSQLRPFYEEFVCSSHASGGFLQLLQYPALGF